MSRWALYQKVPSPDGRNQPQKCLPCPRTPVYHVSELTGATTKISNFPNGERPVSSENGSHYLIPDKNHSLKNNLGAELDLSRVESGHGPAGLGKGIVGFTDVDSIKQVKHVHTQV